MEKKKIWKRVVVVLLTLTVLVLFIVFDPNLKDLDDVLSRISPNWFLCAVGCVLVYYLGDTAMYLIGARLLQAKQPFLEGLLTTMLGFFYSAITPLSSGGQPFQIIQMKKRGISVGTGTSILMLKFLAWHIVITLFGIGGAIALGQQYISGSPGMLVLFIIGVFAHAFCLGLGILLSLRPSIVEKAGNGLISFTGRVFFKRKPEKTEKIRASFMRFISDYREAMKIAGQHKGGMLLIVLTGIIEVGAYLSTTYFIYRGLGLGEVKFFELVLLQAVLTISVAFIPLPGASVASEGGFYAIFTQLFGSSRSVGMLIWRILTYYSSIFLGLIAVFIDGFRDSKPGKKKNIDVPPDAAEQPPDTGGAEAE